MITINNISILLELATIVTCILLIAIVAITRILKGKVALFGILLFINIAFVCFFYLTINMGWIAIAIPIIWLFVPSTLTLSYWYYKFNTHWFSKSTVYDKIYFILPILTILISLGAEVLLINNPESEAINSFRVVWTESMLRYGFPIYSFLLIITSIFKIKIVEKHNEDYYASSETVNIKTAKISLLFFVLFLLGMIFSEFTGPVVSEIIFNLSLLGLTFYLGYFEIKVIANYLQLTQRPSIEKPLEQISQEELISEDAPDESMNLLFSELDQIINEEQLFLKNDLSLYDLASRMQLNSKLLSQAINAQEDLNFNKYINAKRIKHATKMIEDPTSSKFSIEGIATESGFRSKSTFNTAFKSIQGCTPSEYRKKLITE